MHTCICIPTNVITFKDQTSNTVSLCVPYRKDVSGTSADCEIEPPTKKMLAFSIYRFVVHSLMLINNILNGLTDALLYTHTHTYTIFAGWSVHMLLVKLTQLTLACKAVVLVSYC